ncbi:hypothetical protein [Acinetobacter sp. SH20PTE14]|uniref:hypothetical protein n=1 Tax=Acinetobacter sp. SH20PTE14 TaxID=2905879 RepID=UPI001F294D17|nr:hypothetical protein [Acinetobacter sp. SH20PTE14]UIJ76956.1 hypothetical protein LXF01_06835 [Acinetobacter sp. SH20PTE14]UIJ77019.1 hypothetical protein LXF01_07165 [Acinetobacter sp. SH20PTE14]
MKYGLIAAVIVVMALFYFMSQSNKADAERLKQAEVAHQQRLEQNRVDEEKAKKSLEAQRIQTEKARALKAEQDELNSQKQAKEFEQARQAKIQAGLKKIEDKIKAEAFDAASIQFRNQKGNCGEVNAKNRYGGYVGFKRYIYDPQTDYVRIEGEANGYTPSLVIDALWKIECE